MCAALRESGADRDRIEYRVRGHQAQRNVFKLVLQHSIDDHKGIGHKLRCLWAAAVITLSFIQQTDGENVKSLEPLCLHHEVI